MERMIVIMKVAEVREEAEEEREERRVKSERGPVVVRSAGSE